MESAAPTVAAMTESRGRVVHLDTERGFRGGERQVLLLAAWQRRQGLDAWIACRREGQLAEAAAASGVPILPVSGGRGPGGLSGLAGASRVAALLHAHTSHGLQLAFAARALARTAVPIVYSRRIDDVPGAAGAALARRADLVLPVSGAVAGVLRSAGVRSERLQVVHEGVPVCEAPEWSGERLLVHIGALVPQKDQPTLLRAFAMARLPGWRLAILGEGPAEGELRRLSDALGCSSAVDWCGWVPDTGPWLERGLGLVMSSAGEGLCTSVLDAAMRGRPAVVTDAGGLPEAVSEGVTGWVVPRGQPRALAAAFEELVADPAVALARGAAARCHALEAFSVERMARATLAAYATVGASLSPPAADGASPLSR